MSNKLAPPELKKVHPLGKSPLVTIAAPSLSEPIVLAESAAICEYLCDHFAPHLVPTRWREGCDGKVGGETEQWLRYRFYMHYAEGSLMSLLMIAMFMGSKFFLLNSADNIPETSRNLRSETISNEHHVYI
jgi:glutathione S-transferase